MKKFRSITAVSIILFGLMAYNQKAMASFIVDYVGPSFDYMQLLDLENQTITEPIVVNGYGPITGFIELDMPSTAPNFSWGNAFVLDFQFSLKLPNNQFATSTTNPSTACYNDEQGNFDNCNFIPTGDITPLGEAIFGVGLLNNSTGALVDPSAPNAPAQCSDSFNWRETGSLLILSGCATSEVGTWTIRNASSVSSPSPLLLAFLGFASIIVPRIFKSRWRALR